MGRALESRDLSEVTEVAVRTAGIRCSCTQFVRVAHADTYSIDATVEIVPDVVLVLAPLNYDCIHRNQG